jgi:hypothetical protein
MSDAGDLMALTASARLVVRTERGRAAHARRRIRQHGPAWTLSPGRVKLQASIPDPAWRQYDSALAAPTVTSLAIPES